MKSTAINRLESLLEARSLGGALTPSWTGPGQSPGISTGLAGLDAALGGGWRLGEISEIVGARSSGRTSVLVATVAAATARGEIVGLVDAWDRFDPVSAAASGVDLNRVLWVRGATLTVELARPVVLQLAVQRALRAFDLIIRAGPNSKYMPEVLALQRKAKDRLSDSEFRVGLFYFRSRWYRGAVPRFESILKVNSEYLRRDAVYYHLAESLLRVGRTKEAYEYFNKLVEEFKVSDYLDETQARIAEITRLRDAAQSQSQPVTATSSPTTAE